MKEKNIIILDINTAFSVNEYEIESILENKHYCLLCKTGEYEGYNRNMKVDSINKLDDKHMMIPVDDIDNIDKIFAENKEFIFEYMLDIVKHRINNFKEGNRP